jgi:GTP-binding protein
LHLVDATCEHAGKAYKVVRAELDAYGNGLEEKTEIVALSKIDAVTPEVLKEQKARLKRAAKKEPMVLSAATGQGVPDALRAILSIANEKTAEEVAAAKPPEAWHP